MRSREKILLHNRLRMVYEKIPKCSILCDVGTDHGLISILSILEDKCTKCIATDINEGPLKVARKNANRYNVLDRLELRQGDGLATISENESDVVVIAGMGGELIVDILKSSTDKVKLAKLLILQPMNGTQELRLFLYKNGFEICDEELCADGNKIYDVICAKYDGIMRDFDLSDIYTGEKLLDKKDPLLAKLLRRKLNFLEKAFNGMKKSSNVESQIVADTLRLIEIIKIDLAKIETEG